MTPYKRNTSNTYSSPQHLLVLVLVIEIINRTHIHTITTTTTITTTIIMIFSRGVVVLALAITGASAFSPSARSSPAQVSQIVEQSQRFQPRTSAIFVGDDDIDVESPPDEDYIVNVGDLEEDDDDGIEDDGIEPAWYESQQRLEKLRSENRRHDKDTGSPEFQVAGMTERISYLTKHLQQHPKDFSTRRGLVAMVNKRRRLLNYLYTEDQEKYISIIASLGIRHKAPAMFDKETRYSSYPRQKAIKKHLLKK